MIDHADLRKKAEAPSEPTYREAGVWDPDGKKFRTYRDENLNGVVMYVRDAAMSKQEDK